MHARSVSPRTFILAPLLLLQILDALTTIAGLGLGLVERNPAAAGLVFVLGPILAVILYKIAALLVVLALLERVEARWPGQVWHWQVLAVIVVLYVGVVANNLTLVAAAWHG